MSTQERFDSLFKDLHWATERYRDDPHTPELITRIWRNVWLYWGDRTETKFEEIACDRSQEEITELERSGRGIIIIPYEIGEMSNPYEFLLATFPQSRNLRFQITPDMHKDPVPRTGTIDIETSIDAPNRRTGEYQLPKIFESQGVTGQTLIEYMIGTYFSKLTTCHYFDENGTRSRLVGSRRNYWAIDAFTNKEGEVFINSALDPEDRYPQIGARSARSKTAVQL